MIIKSNNPQLTIEEIETFEKEYSISFPTEYKNFLLKHNGGSPLLPIFKVKEDGEFYENVLNVFYGINCENDDLEDMFDFFDDLIEIGFLPIADDPGGNQICIGIDEEHHGKIYFWEHETEMELDNLFFVSNNIQELIDNLY